jgi:hypothetical protein
MWEIIFHTHIKQQVKLQILIFKILGSKRKNKTTPDQRLQAVPNLKCI